MSDGNWFGWIGILIGILGIAVGLFFGLRARKRRELVYSINPVYTRIVRSKEATALKVSYRDEPLGDVDVTALQLAIWNAGNMSIKPDHIRKKIVVAIKPQVRVLEASVRNATPHTGFKLRDTAESRATGRIPVSWKIFERNEGASIQLLYLGTSKVDIFLEGLIEGQGHPKEKATSSSYRSPKEQRAVLKIACLAAIFFFIILLTTTVLKFVFKVQGPEDIVTLIFVMSVFGFPLSLTGILSTMRERFPPFGF